MCQYSSANDKFDDSDAVYEGLHGVSDKRDGDKWN